MGKITSIVMREANASLAFLHRGGVICCQRTARLSVEDSFIQPDPNAHQVVASVSVSCRSMMDAPLRDCVLCRFDGLTASHHTINSMLLQLAS